MRLSRLIKFKKEKRFIRVQIGADKILLFFVFSRDGHVADIDAKMYIFFYI